MKLHILKDILAVVAANIAIILFSKCKVDIIYFSRLFMYVIILIDGSFLLHYVISKQYEISSYKTNFGNNLPTYLFMFVLLYPLFVFLKYVHNCYFP